MGAFARKKSYRAAWSVAVMLTGWSTLAAQPPEPTPTPAEMLKRIEDLEKSNRELRQQLQGNLPAMATEETGVIVPVARQTDKPDDPSGVQSTVPDQLDKDAVKAILDEYMKEQAEQKGLGDEFKEVGDTPPMLGKFQNGWFLQSPDKAFTMRCGIEAQTDMAFLTGSNAMQYGPGGAGDITNGVNIRRGRMDMRGTVYENFEYMIQYDFNLAAAVANSNGNISVFNAPQPTEVWGMITHLPLIRNIRIGNQKPLWSFENWTSSRFQNFMERSLGWDAFVEDQDNAFIPSIVMLNWTENERATMQLGIAKNNHSAFFYNQQDGATMFEGRVSFLPVYLDEGRYLWHVGLGGMYADADNGLARFRARTLIRNGSNQTQNILTEARFFANNESRLVPELVIQLGSFYIQAEYYMAWAGNARAFANPGVDRGTFFGKSYYVQAMYFLTGEHIPYNKQLGRFERIIPHSNYFFMNTCGKRIFSAGAWLTGFRYSFVDLRDLGGLNGANTTPIGATPSSAGVYNIDWCTNWILNPNARIMFDVTYGVRTAANTPASNGPYGGCGMRMQFDF